MSEQQQENQEQVQQEQQQEAQPQAQESVTEERAPAEETVSKAEFERALADMHKYKQQVREMSQASQAEKERLMREQENWKGLAELKEQELNEHKEKLEAIQNSLVKREKFNALEKAARAAGIRDEAINDLEYFGMDKLQVETTSTGRVNVLGVEGAIANLKLSRPYMFGGQKTVVNGNVPNVNNSDSGVVSEKDLIKLSNDARKSGDYTEYEKAFKQYRQQKK